MIEERIFLVIQLRLWALMHVTIIGVCKYAVAIVHIGVLLSRQVDGINEIGSCCDIARVVVNM
jgi:hypothetical protein